MMPTNHFCPKQITVKGVVVIVKQLHPQWTFDAVSAAVRAVSTVASSKLIRFISRVPAVKSQQEVFFFPLPNVKARLDC